MAKQAVKPTKKRRRKSRGPLYAFLGVIAGVIVLVSVLLIQQSATSGRRAGSAAGTAPAADQTAAGELQAPATSENSNLVTGTIYDPAAGGERVYSPVTGDTNWQTVSTASASGASSGDAAQGTSAGTDGSQGASAGGAQASSGTDSAAQAAASGASAAAESTGAESNGETGGEASIVYATSSNINVRSGPGTDSEVLGQAMTGDAFEKTGEEGEWTAILYGGSPAFIKTEFVSTEKPERQSWNLEELDNTPANFGYNSANRDSRNVPTDWEWYESKWGQFDVDWIGDTSKNTIYLTMDEGFGNDNTSVILDTLAEKGVNVTFFLTKYFVDERPDLVQRMLDEGHQLGNHTCTHPNMPSLGIEGETDQIMTLHNLVKDQFGYEMKAFRFPEGVYSDQSLGLVNNLGYKASFWSYAYGDYDEANQPPVDESLQKALDALHPGAIYLLHAASDTNTAFLPDFIDGARERGFEFGVYPLD